ncbi:MAG: hypothetical protein ACREF5_00435 [Candidatus Saccharimonadales bacterium]
MDSQHNTAFPYWRQQQPDHPLFPDLLWSRPERRTTAGKLLIVGGNGYGFSAPAEAFAESEKAGIGETRVLLPDSLKKTVGRTFAAGQFAPSTPSGSFSQKALAEFLDMSLWADGVLVAGDLGRNSETAIILERLAVEYKDQLTLTKDGADFFISLPQIILKRPQTTLVISLAQLQKLASSADFPKAFSFEMDLIRLVETLHEFTKMNKINIVVKHLLRIFVAVNGEVSSTRLAEDQEIWRVKTAADTSTWWLQNKEKTFESLTTAIYTQNQK